MDFSKFVRAAVTSLLMLGVTLSASGCGDDDDGGSLTPETACHEGVGVICSKIFNCFTAAELSMAATVIGNSQADCRTKLGATTCNEDMVRCGSGMKFNSTRARECIDGYQEFSCDQVRGNLAGTTPDPASCGLTCQQE